MKFKMEINYSKEGWVILTFPFFKLHVHKDKNVNTLYRLYDIPIEQKRDLDLLFEKRLDFIKLLIENLGINYYSIAKKDTQTCIIATGIIRPFKYTKIVFKFFGYILDTANEQEYSWIERFQEIDYSLTLSSDKLDKERMLLKIDFKEIDNQPATNNLH